MTIAGCAAKHHGRRQRPAQDEDATVGAVDDDGSVDGEIAEEELEDAGADADQADGADAGGGMAADTGALDVDADSRPPAVEILSPRAPAQFYAFEQVSFRGVCRGRADQATPSARFVVSGPMPGWSAEGNETSHRFELPGSYRVQLVCRDATGSEQTATLDLAIYLTPSLAYTGLASGATSDAVFATRLDQLGQAIQVSPESQALAATITDASYNALHDRVLVRGNLFHRAEEVLALVTPCRSAECAGQDVAYEELVPEAHACKIVRYAWAPDGRSVFASYGCSQAGGLSSYWVDLSAATTSIHPLGTSPSTDSYDGSCDFAAGGVLLFQAGSELKAMDTRAADHPVVSLGSVAGARWQLSPGGDRMLILGDQGYALETSALLAQAAGARRAIPYAGGAPRILQAAQTHLVYTHERVAQSRRTYESGLMRWDGSHDAALCEECLPRVCGDRIALDSLLDHSLSVVRIAEGTDSDIVQTMLLDAGAPPAGVVTDFNEPCALVRYQSAVAPYYPYALWDTESGEWMELPGNNVSPDGRYVSGDRGLWPIARSPLRALAPITTWTLGSGTFSPDGKHFLATGSLANGEGAYQIDLDTHQIARLGEEARLVRFSQDASRVLMNLGSFDQRLVEYAVPSRDRLWQSARGTADWATLNWNFRAVPNSRAVAYQAVLGADGVESIYRSDLAFSGSQRFGALVNTGDAWELSDDGSMLGIESAPSLSLWAFDAQGAAAPLAQKLLDAQTDC
ncbi:MAG TPA: hypothetical protein VJU61_06630, partial [Polyangiaceae bacterium]|nr:hypothetical protein [Polyangiaceae bacterium]